MGGPGKRGGTRSGDIGKRVRGGRGKSSRAERQRLRGLTRKRELLGEQEQQVREIWEEKGRVWQFSGGGNKEPDPSAHIWAVCVSAHAHTDTHMNTYTLVCTVTLIPFGAGRKLKASL